MGHTNDWAEAMGWEKTLDRVRGWEVVARAYSPVSTQVWLDRLTVLYPHIEFRTTTASDQYHLQARPGVTPP